MSPDQLDPGRPLAFFDTSAVLDLMWASVRKGPREEFARAIQTHVGAEPQCGYHPVTLAELASNTHEEVLQARNSLGRDPRSQSLLRQDAERFQRALEALKHSLRGEWDAVLPYRFIPLVPSLSSYVRLFRQRADFRNLRCTRTGVVPLASMVDHQILSLAFFLGETGTPVTFVSGDRDLLGAAAGIGLKWIDSRRPDRTEPWPWKSCDQDERCIAGCSDGVADCERMFSKVSASET